MSLNYRLSPAADQDLVDIWQYTKQQWGIKQANQYLQELEDCFLHIMQSPNLGKQRPEIRQGYYSMYQNKHVIFYRIHLHQLEIVRVLHQRMDIDNQFLR